MRLNPDCVRDVMLAIENTQFLDSHLRVYYTELEEFTKLPELSKYAIQDIAYTLEKLSEGKLINAKVNRSMDGTLDITVNGLTFDGHQYLERIRDDD